MTDTARTGVRTRTRLDPRGSRSPAGPGEVLIRNRAAATNNADLPMLAESDPTTGGHGDEFVAGFDYAGEIAALGPGVDRWRVGDAVMGSAPHSFAEYVLADRLRSGDTVGKIVLILRSR